jgi:hypothetical protein
MIRVKCQLTSAVGRYEQDDYIRPILISIVGYTNEGDEIELGRIDAEQILYSDVIEDGLSLVDVCDGSSGYLADLFGALFNAEGEFQKSLRIDVPTDYILSISKVSIHPKLRFFQSSVFNTVANLFGRNCAMVLLREATELEDRELADLGFSKIARSPFCFRHTGHMNEFSRLYPKGTEVSEDFEVDPEDGNWIAEK